MLLGPYAGVISMTIVLLIQAVFFASTYPDGLEKVAEKLGVEETDPIWEGLMPDYSINFIKHPYLTTLISGLIGL